MTSISQPSQHHSPFGRPSLKTVLAALGVIAVVWIALSVQAAILSQREDDNTAQLNGEIQQIRAQIASPATTGGQTAARQNGAAAAASSSQLQPVTGPVAITATDDKFSQTQIVVAVGTPATITFTNGGTAIHDFHIVGLAGDKGKDVQTALLDGGKSQMLTFTPTQAGTYKFQCDVHPSEMSGTLIVR